MRIRSLWGDGGLGRTAGAPVGLSIRKVLPFDGGFMVGSRAPCLDARPPLLSEMLAFRTLR